MSIRFMTFKSVKSHGAQQDHQSVRTRLIENGPHNESENRKTKFDHLYRSVISFRRTTPFTTERHLSQQRDARSRNWYKIEIDESKGSTTAEQFLREQLSVPAPGQHPRGRRIWCLEFGSSSLENIMGYMRAQTTSRTSARGSSLCRCSSSERQSKAEEQNAPWTVTCTNRRPDKAPHVLP